MLAGYHTRMHKNRRERDRVRRALVEREEAWRDEEEKYEAQRAAVKSPEELNALMEAFGAKRRAYKQQALAAGRRTSGVSIWSRPIWWSRWIEVAVAHEAKAEAALRQASLIDELLASLVAVTAAAYTIEGVYGDMQYLVPPHKRSRKRYLRLLRIFACAFGLSAKTRGQLQREMRWLFELRNAAVHPYSELRLLARHPSGVNTSWDCVAFNAHSCTRAVDAAMSVLDHAAAPPAPANPWLARWVRDRRPYHEQVALLSARRVSQSTASSTR